MARDLQLVRSLANQPVHPTAPSIAGMRANVKRLSTLPFNRFGYFRLCLRKCSYRFALSSLP